MYEFYPKHNLHKSSLSQTFRQTDRQTDRQLRHIRFGYVDIE